MQPLNALLQALFFSRAVKGSIKYLCPGDKGLDFSLPLIFGLDDEAQGLSRHPSREPDAFRGRGRCFGVAGFGVYEETRPSNVLKRNGTGCDAGTRVHGANVSHWRYVLERCKGEHVEAALTARVSMPLEDEK